MSVQPNKQGLVIVGAGPAGLAPLFAAANTGRLHDLLRTGVTILERGKRLGAGALGGYAIQSDSAADALLDIVSRSTDPTLAALRSHVTTQALSRFGKGSAPLKLVGEFLHLAGTTMCELVARSERGQVILGVTADWIQQTRSGNWSVRFQHPAFGFREIETTSVVLATGATQPLHRLYAEPVAGAALLPVYGDKVLQSGQVLAQGGAAEVARRLTGKHKPRIAIVGGSTSAGAVAWSLLNALPSIRFDERGVTILHRRPLRIFYETAAEALAEGYDEFRPEDVCPLTGRVFRLSGFRLDSRELIMRARGLGGRPAEPRLHLFSLQPDTESQAQALLQEADLIIAAVGYRPTLLPVFDAESREIALVTPAGKQWSVVDERSRLLTAQRTPLHGLFAIGLAIGPTANRQLGGEAGFRGQVNSLWLWQHTLGQTIAEQVIELHFGESRAADLNHEFLELSRAGSGDFKQRQQHQPQTAGVA